LVAAALPRVLAPVDISIEVNGRQESGRVLSQKGGEGLGGVILSQ